MYMQPVSNSSDAFFAAVMADPSLVARVIAATKAAKKPKVVFLGNTPKQRAAFGRLSPERQAYLAAWELWRNEWRQWRYFGAANPGPEPVDMVSQEAFAVAGRLAELDRMTQEAEARLMERWGGDMIARDEANASAPTKHWGESEAAHMARVREHLDNAAAAARAKANQATMSLAA